MLSECKDLDAYFAAYGELLGARATATLAPLHVPGRHPDVAGIDAVNEHVKAARRSVLFGAQRDTLSGMVKALRRQKSVILAAEMGCVAGESEVYDPVAKVYRRVDQITEPFHVVSYHAYKEAVGKAHVPFIKGTRGLYRVSLSSGRSFLATDNHLMLVRKALVPGGQDLVHQWAFVREVAELIRRGEPCLLPSTEEPFPSASPPGGPRWTRTPGDSRDGCPTRCRSCGGRLHPDAEFALASALLQADAAAHTRENPTWGDLIYAAGHSQLCPRFAHLATQHSDPLPAGTSPGDASEPRSGGGPRGQTGTTGRAGPRSADTSLPPSTNPSSAQPAIQTADPSFAPREFADEMVHVVNVIYERTDVYYDFTVEKYHNYVMAGVVHHNTGKSLMGCAAGHVHAGGRPYRGLVMCPDHLIKKWGREIELTVPGAAWRSFADWREFLAAAECHDRPAGPEWWVVGRDQSKGDPAWETRVVRRRQFVVERRGRKRLRAKGVELADLTGGVAACPRCGHVVTDKDGNPLAYGDVRGSKKKLTCKGTLPSWRTEGDDCVADGTPCGEPLWSFVAARTKEARAARKAGREAEGLATGTAPYRWPPYRAAQGRMRRDFDYLILDEAHELKGGDEVGQANAAGAFISRSRKVIALTGTLIGGYADHLFPLLLRAAPRSLVAGGFGWSEFSKFNARYGRIETVVHNRSGGKAAGNERSNSHTKGSSTKVTRIRRPGVMPQLYGDHLIDKVCFLTLDQVAEGLPALTETIVPVGLDSEQAQAYGALERWLRATISAMLAKGDKRLLASMLESLLYWPDHPFGWPAIRADADDFTPATLDESVVRPKEEALIALCAAEAAAGRQTWVYVQRTGTRDVGARLVRLLGAAGLRAGMLRSSVSPREREEWIYKKGHGLDVCVSHPDLVKTGLDLFSNDGGKNHNFATLVFYQTGYNTFTLRQASRRSWRVGQRKPCKTVFIYYQGTMQEQAMTHMGKKMAACEAIDGKFSAEGLAAMAGEDDATMALARALVDRVVLPAGVTWSKTLGFEKPKEAPPATVTRAGVTFTADELDMLRRLHALTAGA